MENSQNYCVILAGGRGRRLWPSSREACPKQFIDFFGTGRTQLQATYDRVIKLLPKENIYICTCKEYLDIVRQQLPEVPERNVMVEPIHRNTAPSVAWAAMRIHKKNPEAVSETSKAEHTSIMNIIVLLVLGCASLVFGGHLMVNNAADLAREWGISERIIGLTILAAGTSLPELATSMMAARKGSNGLALGNAIGSNVFNIAFVIGICSIVKPMAFSDISIADWFTLIFSNVLLWVLAYARRRLASWKGAILVAAYIAYLLYILIM